jgi:hypothetical protein
MKQVRSVFAAWAAMTIVVIGLSAVVSASDIPEDAGGIYAVGCVAVAIVFGVFLTAD